jgi:hypothetical protein
MVCTTQTLAIVRIVRCSTIATLDDVISEHAMLWCCLATADAVVDTFTAMAGSGQHALAPCFVLWRVIEPIGLLGRHGYRPAITPWDERRRRPDPRHLVSFLTRQMLHMCSI